MADVCVHAYSVVSNFATLWTAAHQALHPWDFPDKNTGSGGHALLQGYQIFMSTYMPNVVALIISSLSHVWLFCNPMLHIINFYNSPQPDTVIMPLLQIKQWRHRKPLAQGQQLGFQQLSPALSCTAKPRLGALGHSLVQITAIHPLQRGQKIFKLLKISFRLKACWRPLGALQWTPCGYSREHSKGLTQPTRLFLRWLEGNGVTNVDSY